jgi:hypothetical protein
MVEAITSPLEQPFNHAGIFAQAKALYDSGFRYWFDSDEIDELSTHNRNFQAPCLEEELISMCFRKPGPEEVPQLFSTAYILQYIASNIGSKLTSHKVAKAMRELGFEQKRSKNFRGWICIPLTPEEMIAERKRLAR